MDNRIRIMQANLNNLGGAFSVAYEAQKKLNTEYVFDYFFPDKFVKNDVYNHLVSMGSKCIGEIKCKNRFFKQYMVYKTFKEYLMKNNYKHVHIHGDTAWKISIYYLAAKHAGIKNIVIHSHSSGINGHFKKINYCLHILAKKIIKKAKYKCACSDIAAKWMYYDLTNVQIIHNGVDIEKYKFNSNSRKKIREELGINDKIVIGSVGDFSYPKNPEFIYEIIKKFKDNKKYAFLFVGNRKDCLLKKYIEKDSTIQNVIFCGMVTNVQDYLSAMDIFILPSRFEGLPMCALEAQVNGLYTIISDKITQETKCSINFNRLNLDINKWKKEIENVNFNFKRNDIQSFLDFDKANSSDMAEKFKKIYLEKG